MPTFTTDPTAVGHEDNWSFGVGSDKVSAVTAPDDDDTTYLRAGAAGIGQLYHVPDVGTGDVPSGASIVSITLTVRARCTNPSGFNSFNHTVGDGTDTYETQAAGDLLDGVGNYADYDYAWTTDPVTGVEWDEATLRDWGSAGATPRSFGVVANLSTGSVRMTTVQVTIEYEVGNLSLDAAAVTVSPGSPTAAADPTITPAPVAITVGAGSIVVAPASIYGTDHTGWGVVAT